MLKYGILNDPMRHLHLLVTVEITATGYTILYLSCLVGYTFLYWLLFGVLSAYDVSKLLFKQALVVVLYLYAHKLPSPASRLCPV